MLASIAVLASLARRAAPLAALSALSAAACDSSGPGAPYAEFVKDDEPLARQIAGRVHRGSAMAYGVVVRRHASPTSAEAQTFVPGEATVTDAFGFYQFSQAPGRYDLSMRRDREVVVYRDLGFRYVEPSFGDDAIPSAWSAELALTVEPAPTADRRLSFFASGQDVVGISGDLEAGLRLAIRQFSLPALPGQTPPTVHVVEHPAGASVGAATAYGRVEVVASAGKITPATVRLTPIAQSNAGVVDVEAPPGFSVPEVEVSMHFGLRAEAHVVGKVAPGGAVSAAPVPNAIYVVHARGSRGDAVSDSGQIGWDPLAKRTVVKLPEPPALEDAQAGVFSARATGPREHAFRRTTGDDVVRVVTGARAVAVADLARVTASPPAGKYTWAVRHWPSLALPENLGGPDARVTVPWAEVGPVIVDVP